MALKGFLCLIRRPLPFYPVKTIALILLTFSLAPLAFSQFDTPAALKSISKVQKDGTMLTTVVNPERHTTEEIHSDSSGKVIRKTLFIFNENNVASGAVYYDGKGVIRYKERYTLDSSNRVSESAIFSATDQSLGRRVFNYDAKGNPHVADYDAAGKLMTQNPASTKRSNNAPPSTPTVRRALPAR